MQSVNSDHLRHCLSSPSDGHEMCYGYRISHLYSYRNDQLLYSDHNASTCHSYFNNFSHLVLSDHYHG
jgi:hypothetical protein